MTASKLHPPVNEGPAEGEHGMGPGPALLIWACSLPLMALLSFFIAAYPVKTSMPVFVAAVAVFAVLLPAASGLWWVSRQSGGQLPRYTPPSLDLMALVVLVSLPLYALSATLLTALGDVRLGEATPMPGASWWAWLGLWAAFALLPAFSEELMYRGLLQPAIARRWGLAWGIGLTAALFALTHMEPLGVIPRVLMGIWFGYLAWRTDSLWSCTWAHTWNNTWGVLYLTFYATIAAHPWWVFFVCLLSLGLAFPLIRRLGWLNTEVDHEEPEPRATDSVRLVPLMIEAANDGPAPTEYVGNTGVTQTPVLPVPAKTITANDTASGDAPELGVQPSAEKAAPD